MTNSQRLFRLFCFSVVVNLIMTEVGLAAKWTNTYDNMDRLTGRTDPLGRSESLAYDLGGNLTRFTDRKGQITNFTYDPLNRLIAISYADNSTTTISYDSVGRPVALIDSIGGRIDLAYDNLNRVVRETTGLGTVAYTYDSIGRRASMTANGQAPTNYSYDTASRLTQVAQGAQVVVIGYDNKGHRTSLTYPNGTTTTYSYDAASRLTGIFHERGVTNVESISYVYDAAGNRTAAVRGSNPAAILPGTLQATYDAANEQISLDNALFTLIYDANGNLLSRTDLTGTTTYTWDARNRLIAVTGPGLTASFVYDALNRRISKTVNGISTQYLYDRNDIVQEINGSAVTATYLRSLNVDEVFVRMGASPEYYHTDAQGTTMMLTDATGIAKTTYTYTPFGETTVTGAASSNPFQLTGRENDGSGLYYYRARYYSPSLHRFISEDPIRFRGRDINLYRYAYSNPTRFRDPQGLWGFGGDIGASGAYGIGVAGAALNSSAGFGAFWGGDAGLNLGCFESTGAFIGGPGYGPSYPEDDTLNVALGAFAGVGGGAFLTNANSAKELESTSYTAAYDMGIGPINFSFSLSYGYGDDGRFLWLGSLSAGPGVGVGRTHFSTNTTSASGLSCGGMGGRK